MSSALSCKAFEGLGLEAHRASRFVDASPPAGPWVKGFSCRASRFSPSTKRVLKGVFRSDGCGIVLRRCLPTTHPESASRAQGKTAGSDNLLKGLRDKDAVACTILTLVFGLLKCRCGGNMRGSPGPWGLGFKQASGLAEFPDGSALRALGIHSQS